MKINKTELAYMAGILDGEGSVGLYLCKKSYRYPGITVCNTVRELVEPFKKYFGGSIRLKRRLGKYKSVYIYTSLSSQGVLKIIKLLKPYIRESEKKRRMRLLQTAIEKGVFVNYMGKLTPRRLKTKQRLEQEFYRYSKKKIKHIYANKDKES